MEVFQHTFTQMLMLFAIMLCGFIARKKRMTDDLFDGNLSKLVMSITLPATILNSVLSDSQLPPDEVILTMFGYAALYFLFAAVFSYAVAHLVYRKLNRPARGAHAFMMMFGNVGFLGFAVLAAIFDDNAVLYAAVFNIVFNVVLFSLGVFFVAGDDEQTREKRSVKMQLKALGHTLTKPVMLASYAAMALALLHITDNGPHWANVQHLGRNDGSCRNAYHWLNLGEDACARNAVRRLELSHYAYSPYRGSGRRVLCFRSVRERSVPPCHSGASGCHARRFEWHHVVLGL